ncbi:MAG: caspase family protein [Saprospiraceae bacterium]|nr:caspase family protein [Saprospiraceae bacterium]
MDPMHIYAVLVGINAYSRSALKGCLTDVRRMQTYLTSLPATEYQAHVRVLLDEQATKPNIEIALREHLAQASGQDIALFYFSGHGVQEKAPEWLARYEHDGQIECLVCYDLGQEDYLMADKELRYIFSQTIQDPDVRVITMFDCCHSGDNMRAFLADAHTPRRWERSFPERGFDKFLFADAWSQDQLEQDLDGLLPVRHDVHISACRAYQQAYEDKELQHGIFTDFLLRLLEGRNSDIRYADIKQIAKLRFSSKHDKQIPEVSVRHKGNVSMYDGWLGRTLDAERLAIRAEHLGEEMGWVVNAGQMHGLQKGDGVKLLHGGNLVTDAKLDEIQVDKAKLTIPAASILDTQQSYQVELMLQARPTVYCQAVDVNEDRPELLAQIQEWLREREQLATDEVHFDIVIFSGFAYLTNPGDRFRPRAEQIPITPGEDGDEIDLGQLAFQLEALGKAFGITQLHNPDTIQYQVPPLKVEMGLLNDDTLQDVTNGVFVATPASADRYEVKMQLKITNVSKDPVFVSAAVVSELGGIYTDLVFPEMSIKLKAGETYEATGNQRPYFALEHYKRFYNWPDEHIEYKLVVSSHEPVELSSFDQEELDPPQLCGLRNLAGKGTRRVREEERKPDWGTVDCTVRLRNPDHNDLSLMDKPELDCALLRPFAQKNFTPEV